MSGLAALVLFISQTQSWHSVGLAPGGPGQEADTRNRTSMGLRGQQHPDALFLKCRHGTHMGTPCSSSFSRPRACPHQLGLQHPLPSSATGRQTSELNCSLAFAASAKAEATTLLPAGPRGRGLQPLLKGLLPAWVPSPDLERCLLSSGAALLSPLPF